MKPEFLKKVKTGFRDKAIYIWYFIRNLILFISSVFRNGPFEMFKRFRRYSWLSDMMKSVDLLEAMVCTRTGLYREANLFTILSINKGSSDMFDEVFSGPEKVVFHEDLIPPEILFGMGLNPWLVELLGIIGPLMERTFAEPYIDVAENEGIPPDVCSLPKSTIGLVLEGQMPEPIAMVTSNMPCDGGMSSYTVIEREIKVPTFRLDIPHNFNNERAIEYFVGELKRLITWLEEHTSGRMDWDRMREVCEERNRATEYELELWDMILSL